jgi:hypothetical protein
MILSSSYNIPDLLNIIWSLYVYIKLYTPAD